MPARVGFEGLECRRLLTTNTWVGSSGDWSDATHWSLGHAPLATEDVSIIPNVTVTVASGTQTAQTITTDPTDTISVNGGTLTIGADSTVTGDLNLSSGIVESLGTLTLAGANSVWSGGTINGSFAGSGSGTFQISGDNSEAIGSEAMFDFPPGCSTG